MRSSSLRKLLNAITPGISQSTNNVMIPELFDSALHPTSPKWILNLEFDEEGCHDRENIDGDSNPEEHNRHVENSQRRTMRGINDLPVTHTGKGDDSHVQRL